MGLKMNSNKREILVFAKTCKTALEGRIVRAHNALAYCWLFCFLTVRPIYLYLFLSYLNLLSHRPVGRLLRNFASWSEVAVVLINWHQISPTPLIKILSAKGWTKIWHLVPSKIEKILAVWRSLGQWLQKVAIFTPKGTSLREHTSFKPFCVKIGWGVWPTGRLGENKESHRDSNRNDMSPLTQGLN